MSRDKSTACSSEILSFSTKMRSSRLNRIGFVDARNGLTQLFQVAQALDVRLKAARAGPRSGHLTALLAASTK